MGAQSSAPQDRRKMRFYGSDADNAGRYFRKGSGSGNDDRDVRDPITVTID